MYRTFFYERKKWTAVRDMNILDMSKNEETLRSTLIHLYSKRRNAEWYPKIAHFFVYKIIALPNQSNPDLGRKMWKGV